MKNWVYVLLVCCLVFSAGCATPDRVSGHILQPTDRELPAYQDNLVILDVRVESDIGALKLRDVDLRNVDTGLPWRIALFDNVFMKTQALPFEERDGAIYHTIVTDMPAGTYEIDTLEFQDYIANLAGPDTSRKLVHQLTEPLMFEVQQSAQPQYLGTLNLDVQARVTSSVRDATSEALAAAHEVRTGGEPSLDPGGTDAMLGAAATATAVDIQEMRGSVDVSVTPPDSASARVAGNRYRALSGSTITPGRMWVQTATP